MRTLNGHAPTGRGSVTLASAPLGKGGEGSVFEVLEHNIDGLAPADNLVAKIYHDSGDQERKAKVVAMIKAPPSSDSLAWPVAVLSDNGAFAGYLMRKLDTSGFRPWLELAHAGDRRMVAPDFDVRYAMVAVRNLAAAVASVHRGGHCLGDINESNIFIAADARILIVDTDSAQIVDRSGRVFPCLVGKPEYTAPELRGSLRDTPRTPATDLFALAVCAFQMITGGCHPTDGGYTGDDETPDVTSRIRRGVYPGLGIEADGFVRAPRVPTDAIPGALRTAVLDGLHPDPAKRTRLGQFGATLDDVVAHLVQCPTVPQHWYDSRDGQCGWCLHAKRAVDPWAPTAPSAVPGAPSQVSLPSLSFGSGPGAAPSPHRAAPQVAGSAAQVIQTPDGSQYAPQQGVVVPPGYQLVPEEEPEAIPSKVGRKSVLVYGDGSWDVRPPLTTLFRRQPGLALRCFFDELPGPLKFWWPRSRPAPTWTGVLLAFVVGLVFAGLWALGIPWTAGQFGVSSGDMAIYTMAGLASGAVAALTVFIYAVSALVARIRRRYETRETVWQTIRRAPLIALVFGPVGLAATAVWLAGLALLGLLAKILDATLGR